jgi:hypothetical protein
MGKPDPGDEPDKHDKEVSVTVRTPAGASAPFDFKENTRVDKVIREAVLHFVATGELAPGDFGLALVRDGAATPLEEDSRLDDDGVVDGDVLHLTNKGAQVDG